MSKVTFYLLETPTQSPEYFACRLIDKAWRQGLTMHVHTSNETSCKAMDQLLWSWREESFLPHATLGHPGRATPITVGFTEQLPSHKELLINLDAKVPVFFHEYPRVCEVVVQVPQQKAVSREKFRFYRQAGIEPETHKMQ